MQTGAAFGAPMHTAPQAPQFDVSLLVSTQEVPHWVFGPQSVMHTPPWQTEPAPQATPHAPQFAASALSSTHLPPQLVYPALQLTPHWPAAHVATPFGGGAQT
jgi:hypothetical protein